jgi:hypothetical protein
MATAKNEGDSGLQQAIKKSLKLYAAGDKRFFDYLDDDVRVYTVESAKPIIGRKAFQAYFGKTLARTKRKISVVASEVRSAGDHAIQNQTLQVTAEGVSSYLRQTVVWKLRPNLAPTKVAIHNSLVGQPVFTGKLPKTTDAVRVINERIATVAAVLGVAQ